LYYNDKIGEYETRNPNGSAAVVRYRSNIGTAVTYGFETMFDWVLVKHSLNKTKILSERFLISLLLIRHTAENLHVTQQSIFILQMENGFEAGVTNFTNNSYFRRATGYPVQEGIIPSDARSFYTTLESVFLKVCNY
jgi:hypothetical protein